MTAFLDGRVAVRGGDCREVLRALPEALFDAAVTDPPYHLTSVVKRFGADGAAPAGHGTNGAFARASRGFMGKTWDGGDVAFDPATWAEVLRVMKPGAHLAAFGGTKGFHRMAVAIEDAGFEIRDTVMWVYGSGFPKSLNVAQAIDKEVRGFPQGGADPTSANHGRFKGGCSSENATGRGFGAGPGQFMREAGERQTRELVDEAQAWQGWGTALKPAFEPIVLARKPLVGTVAANVTAYGTGALNIDACRVPLGADDALQAGVRHAPRALDTGATEGSWGFKAVDRAPGIGRWPANLVHDGSEEVAAAFPAAPGQQGATSDNPDISRTREIFGAMKRPTVPSQPRGDAGSAARFFYCAKATAADRAGSKHPTVKPIALMRWLVRLVTPPGGLILDPFAGTGTTAEAAILEGRLAALIEQDATYQADIAQRMQMLEARLAPHVEAVA